MNRLDLLATAALKMILDGSVVGLGSGRAATAFVQASGSACVTAFACGEFRLRRPRRTWPPSWQSPWFCRTTSSRSTWRWMAPTRWIRSSILSRALAGRWCAKKVVASASRRLVILVGAEKLVSALGERGVLPVEVVPFALAWSRRRLTQLGYPAAPRQSDGKLFVSDNGNHILDCQVPVLHNPQEFERLLREIPGIVGTGLFLGYGRYGPGGQKRPNRGL